MFTLYVLIKLCLTTESDDKQITHFHDTFSSLFDTAVGIGFLYLGWRRVVVKAKLGEVAAKIQSRLLKEISELS